MPQTTFIDLRQEWQEAWQVALFRRRVISGVIIVAALLSTFPVFFQHIERRHGALLYDPVLAMLPPLMLAPARSPALPLTSILPFFMAAPR